MRFTSIVRGKNQITIPIEIVGAYKIRRADYIELELIKVKK